MKNKVTKLIRPRADMAEEVSFPAPECLGRALSRLACGLRRFLLAAMEPSAAKPQPNEPRMTRMARMNTDHSTRLVLDPRPSASSAAKILAIMPDLVEQQGNDRRETGSSLRVPSPAVHQHPHASRRVLRQCRRAAILATAASNLPTASAKTQALGESKPLRPGWPRANEVAASLRCALLG